MILRLVALVVLFFGSQYIAGICVLLYTATVYGGGNDVFDPAFMQQHPGLLGPALIAANVGLIALLRATRLLPRLRPCGPPPPARAFGAALLATAGSVVAVNILIEWLAIPDWQEDTFRDICTHPASIVAVALTGPLTEELVFRRGFIEPWLGNGKSPAVAIVLSALVFGLVHANPSQTVAATVIGALFGWFYVRGDLWLSVAAHVFNNALGIWSIRTLGDNSGATLADTLGMPLCCVLLAVALAAAVLGIVLLNRSNYNRYTNEKNSLYLHDDPACNKR